MIGFNPVAKVSPKLSVKSEKEFFNLTSSEPANPPNTSPNPPYLADIPDIS